MRFSTIIPLALSILSVTPGAIATSERDCWRYLLDLFEDFDGGVPDGLVSPDDIRNNAYRLPSDCEQQLLDSFGEVDTAAQGGNPDGLISKADLDAFLG